MAGHSKWANIQHRKGRQDAKRGKLFTKLIREITVAAKLGGSDSSANPRLRAAIDNGLSNNMAKDTIDRAVKHGAGGDENSNVDEIRYEGYGPNGVAVIVDTMTDNKNRTVSELRQIFSKNGGSIADSGNVSHTFKRKGELVYKIEKSFESKIFDLAVEFGADDIITDNENCIIYCEPEKINNIKEKVSTLSIEPTSISLTWISSNKININNKEDEKKFFNLINELEDNEDVQNVSSNYGIS